MAEFSAKANPALQNMKKINTDTIAFLKLSPQVSPKISYYSALFRKYLVTQVIANTMTLSRYI